MANTDATIATRVRPDVRARLDAAVAARAGRGETMPGPNGPRPYALADALRAAADLWLNVEEGLTANPLTQTSPGAARRTDPATSKQAARDAAPRAGSQRRRVLGAFARFADSGRTTDEVLETLEWLAAREMRIAPAQNSVARRVTDLLEAGAVAPMFDEHGKPLTRTTRHGRPATVYKITPKGLAWLEETNP